MAKDFRTDSGSPIRSTRSRCCCTGASSRPGSTTFETPDARTRLRPVREPAAATLRRRRPTARPADRSRAAGSRRDRPRRADPAHAARRQHPQLVPGPLLAHPSSGERLPIAHASDQLRAVIPDGREDISLAAAFEVGRLLALSSPAMVAALMRWRQAQFQAARSGASGTQLVDRLPFEARPGRHPPALEGKLRSLITTDPDQFIGAHRPLVTPGDPVDWGANPLTVLGRGLGLEVDLGRQFARGRRLRRRDRACSAPRSPPVDRRPQRPGAVNRRLRDVCTAALDTVTEQLVSNVLANEIAVDPGLGAGVIRTPDVGTVVRRRAGRRRQRSSTIPTGTSVDRR